jgi:hypothetical protein
VQSLEGGSRRHDARAPRAGGDFLARYFAAIPAPYEPYFEKEMVQDSGFTEEQKQYLEGFS